MTKLIRLTIRLGLWKETNGQAFIECAMIAGMVAVAAGAMLPGLAASISATFSKVAPLMSRAATQAG